MRKIISIGIVIVLISLFSTGVSAQTPSTSYCYGYHGGICYTGTSGGMIEVSGGCIASENGCYTTSSNTDEFYNAYLAGYALFFGYRYYVGDSDLYGTDSICELTSTYDSNYYQCVSVSSKTSDNDFLGTCCEMMTDNLADEDIDPPIRVAFDTSSTLTSDPYEAYYSFTNNNGDYIVYKASSFSFSRCIPGTAVGDKCMSFCLDNDQDGFEAVNPDLPYDPSIFYYDCGEMSAECESLKSNLDYVQDHPDDSYLISFCQTHPTEPICLILLDFSNQEAYFNANCPPLVDCDDENPAVYPGAPEYCDGVDNQCALDPGYGLVDEGCIKPIILSVGPSGDVEPGTVTLTATTDINVECRYSTQSGMYYPSMTLFTNTGGTVHSADVQETTIGRHDYYVKCKRVV